MTEHKRMEFDAELLPMVCKHRRKAAHDLERLLEMDPSERVEQAMIPAIMTLIGAEFIEDHVRHHGMREHEDAEEHHTGGYHMSR